MRFLAWYVTLIDTKDMAHISLDVLCGGIKGIWVKEKDCSPNNNEKIRNQSHSSTEKWENIYCLNVLIIKIKINKWCVVVVILREILREIQRLRQEQELQAKTQSETQARNPTLLAELRLLRQRRDELEARMSALQESRRELMVQLEGLMKLLKVSVYWTPLLPLNVRFVVLVALEGNWYVLIISRELIWIKIKI